MIVSYHLLLIDDDAPKVPDPAYDSLMSPQARRYWVSLKPQSEKALSSSSDKVNSCAAS